MTETPDSQKSKQSLHYESRRPAAGLLRAVAEYSRFRVDKDAEGNLEHFVPPDAAVSLVAFQPKAGSPVACVWLGPRLDPFQPPIAPGASYWSVRFQVGAAGSAGIQPEELVDQRRPPDRTAIVQLLTSSVLDRPELCRFASTMDEALPQLLDLEKVDAAIATAVEAIAGSGGNASIPAARSATGLSERQFQRRFRRAVGMTAKSYARVERLRSTLEAQLLARLDLSTAAHNAGFADQSHMNREYRQLVGPTPPKAGHHLRSIRHDRD